MTTGNGRRGNVEGGSQNNPEDDFPIRDTYTDFAGKERCFVISYDEIPLGFSVAAEEEGKRMDGYYFREFDPTSPYLALGRMRGRIRKALSTRYLEESSDGLHFSHRLVEGRVGYRDEEMGVVIDGRFISMEAFTKMLETYEGFEFRLEILD